VGLGNLVVGMEGLAVIIAMRFASAVVCH